MEISELQRDLAAVFRWTAKLNMNVASLWDTVFSGETFGVFLGLTLVISATFITNQIADTTNAQVDIKSSLIDQYISVDLGKTITKILLLSGGVILIISNWMIAIPVACIYFLWGIGYNQSILLREKMPIAIWLIHSCVGVLLFIIGWMLGMENYLQNGIFGFSLETCSYMLPYVLCFSAISLLTTLQDRGGNDSDVKIIPTVFEHTTSLLIILLMVSLAVYFSLKLADPLSSTATLVSLPFFIVAAFRRLNKDIVRAIRYPIFILNFFSLTYYPLLIVPLLCTYYLSKYYYWHRFDLHYPTFLVDND